MRFIPTQKKRQQFFAIIYRRLILFRQLLKSDNKNTHHDHTYSYKVTNYYDYG